jgi:hypothetical protein
MSDHSISDIDTVKLQINATVFIVLKLLILADILCFLFW